MERALRSIVTEAFVVRRMLNPLPPFPAGIQRGGLEGGVQAHPFCWFLSVFICVHPWLVRPVIYARRCKWLKELNGFDPSWLSNLAVKIFSGFQGIHRFFIQSIYGLRTP